MTFAACSALGCASERGEWFEITAPRSLPDQHVGATAAAATAAAKLALGVRRRKVE